MTDLHESPPPGDLDRRATRARVPSPGGPVESAPPAAPAPPPASGAWRPEHGAGRRRFAALGPLALESGERLESVTMAYESWGRLNADGSNAVLILHALTGDSHVRGPAGPSHPSPGWWEWLVGPGRPVDTDRFAVIAPNVLGGCQGSTGPSSPAPDGRPWGSRFPTITVRDQVAAERALRDHLGIERWALVTGGSMGGMRAVEWGVSHPGEVARLALIATSACATADQIAWNGAQIAAIEMDPGFHRGDYYGLPDGQGPHTGLGLARRIAHTTYRTAGELETRFSHHPQDGEDPLRGTGRHQVTSYLDHHAHKLVGRFDANSYRTLVRAMSTHDVGRDRGGTEQALARIRARTLVVGIDSDRLFPVRLTTRMGRAIPSAQCHAISSPIGHDAFLLAQPQLQEWITALLAR